MIALHETFLKFSTNSLPVFSPPYAPAVIYGIIDIQCLWACYMQCSREFLLLQFQCNAVCSQEDSEALHYPIQFFQTLLQTGGVKLLSWILDTHLQYVLPRFTCLLVWKEFVTYKNAHGNFATWDLKHRSCLQTVVPAAWLGPCPSTHLVSQTLATRLFANAV